MNEQTIHLALISYTSEPFECDCCGTCFPEGCAVQFNGQDIWNYDTDGHLGGSQTDETIIETIIHEVAQLYENSLEKLRLESSRLDHARQFPLASVSRTPEDWAQYCDSCAKSAQSDIQSLKESLAACVHPYSKEGQIKLAALWIEECCGFKVELSLDN